MLRQDLTAYDGKTHTYTDYDALKEIGAYWKVGYDRIFQRKNSWSINGFGLSYAREKSS
jgi:hypothetical protein